MSDEGMNFEDGHRSVIRSYEEDIQTVIVSCNTTEDTNTEPCECKHLIRPSVIRKHVKKKAFTSTLLMQTNPRYLGISTRVKDSPHSIGLPRSSAFEVRDWRGKDARELAVPSRLSYFDFQDLQHRPVVILSRPRDNQMLTSYLHAPLPNDKNLKLSREPAQNRHEKNSKPSPLTALFPRCQGNRNPRVSYFRDDPSSSISGHTNDIQCHEDDHVTLSLENHEDERIKSVALNYAEQSDYDTVIQKLVAGQSLGADSYHMLHEGSELYSERQPSAKSPNSDIQEAHYIPRREKGESRDVQEKEEEEEKINAVKEESPEERHSTHFGQEPRSESVVEQYEREAESDANKQGDEIQAYLSLANNKETQGESVDGPQRTRDSKSTSNSLWQDDKMQTTRQHSSMINSMRNHKHYHQASTSNMQDYENKSNPNCSEKEIQKRAEHLSKYWAESHKGGTTCLVCFKTLKRSYYVKSHMLIHTGDKPYSCAYCSKTFTQVGNRNAHQRIHTGEKSYACDYCDKRFVFNSSKHNHMKIHCRGSSVGHPIS